MISMRPQPSVTMAQDPSQRFYAPGELSFPYSNQNDKSPFISSYLNKSCVFPYSLSCLSRPVISWSQESVNFHSNIWSWLLSQGKAKRNLISGIALGLWTDRAFNWIGHLVMKCGIQLSPSSNVLSEAISTSEKYWVGWRYFFDWRLHRGLVLLHQHAIRCYFIDSSFLRASG